MQAPFGIYETRDGDYVSIAMSPYKTLYETLEAPQLAVYDDLDHAVRQARRGLGEGQRRDQEVRHATTCSTGLLAADIWCAAVNDIRAASKDPQVVHGKMITSYEHPKAGTVRVVAPAVTMSETPATIDRPAPLVGQHGREILARIRRFGEPRSMRSRPPAT